DQMRNIVLSSLLILAFALVLPLFFSNYGMLLWTEIFIMGIFAMSLGLIMGYAGLDSLGHAAFFGMGAYTVALLGQYVSSTYLLILAAILLTGIIALVTGSL